MRVIKNLCYILFIFEHNILKNKVINFFYIFYENLSIDLICLLSLFIQKYYFIKLKNVSNKILNNNLESNFLTNNLKLENSNFCLLVNINIKLESTNLNLILKQRNLKGNFKLLSISSFFNLTNNLKFIGVTNKLILLICKGLHPLCQTLKYEKNSCIIFNSQFLELNISKFLNILVLYLKKFIKYYNINMINSNIYEPGIYFISNLLNNNKMLCSFSSIYTLNLTNIKYNFIVKSLDLIFYYFIRESYLFKIKKICLTHDNLFNNYLIQYVNYFSISVKNFYEDSAIFFNTQGFVKKNLKIFNNYKLGSSWKILRIILNSFKNKLSLYTFRYNLLINYNLFVKFTFLKFIYLLLLAKKPINNNNLINNTNQFISNKIDLIYGLKIKFLNLRFKFWLNDFYTGGRDNFSPNSLVMLKCSKLIRLQLTNFS